MIDYVIVRRRSINSLLLLFCGILLLQACGDGGEAVAENAIPDKEMVVNETPTVIASAIDSVEQSPIVEEVAEKPKETVEKEEQKEEDKEKEKEKKKKRSKKRPKITFDSEVHEYGKILQGDQLEHKFKFRNTGKADLIVKNVTASCGCTQPSYPFIPISPGEEGFIGVIFDSKGKLGKQKATITVVTNARPHTYKLYLEGFVDAEEAEQ